MKSVGSWMNEIGAANKKWWQLDLLDDEQSMQKYATTSDYYALLLNGLPAASAILLRNKPLQDWSAVDGDGSPDALYLHWVTVAREFRGGGLVEHLVVHAKKLAQQLGISRLRLDTNALEPKLCSLYRDCGVTAIAEVAHETGTTALFEMLI